MRRFTPQHVELMTKRQDLCLQRRSRPEQSDRRQPDQDLSRFLVDDNVVRVLCHIVGVVQSPQPYDLVTRPCTIHAGRFRWDIRQNGRPVQSSMESFASEQEAHVDGRRELEKLMQVSKLNR
jgi:hypothetical protein